MDVSCVRLFHMMIDTRKEQKRDELHRTIWAVAAELRRAVDGRDFKNYVPETMNGVRFHWILRMVQEFPILLADWENDENKPLCEQSDDLSSKFQ